MADEGAKETGGRRADVWLLLGYCVVLFGSVLFFDRPLSVHESVLPLTARSMYADGDWLVPKVQVSPEAGPGESGGLPTVPWLENPPLPQWCTVAIATAVGRCDRPWIPRLGAMLMATGAVLLTGWMGRTLFGGRVGLLSGLCLASLCEFTRYAWLAEDEIYLCTIVTLAVAAFVRLEFGPAKNNDASRWGWFRGLFGPRSLSMVALFAALGLTNLVKGLMFGAVIAGIPLVVYLVGTLDLTRVRRYAWAWGIALFFAIMLAWPLMLLTRYPDAVDLWHYDIYGRIGGDYQGTNEPLGYYPLNMLWMLMPWTLTIPFGMAATWRTAWRERTSPARFLWCWALAVPLVLTIPSGKHHHYLLHALAPWAMLGALGIAPLRAWLATWPRWIGRPETAVVTVGLPLAVAAFAFKDRLPEGLAPAWVAAGAVAFSVVLAYAFHGRQARRAGVVAFGLVAVLYVGGNRISGQSFDRSRHDVAFHRQWSEALKGDDRPLVTCLTTGVFTSFLATYYHAPSTRIVINPTFLRAESLRRSPEIHVIARLDDRAMLERYGDVEVVDSAAEMRHDLNGTRKTTLFRLRYRPETPSLPTADVRISPLQAMTRRKGPFLGAEDVPQLSAAEMTDRR